MTMGELVRALLAAHVDGDDAGFRGAAEALIVEERRKNHPVLANDLERVLSNGSQSSKRPFLVDQGVEILGALPSDKERGMPLVSVSTPVRSIDSIVLGPVLRRSIERIREENRNAELLGTYGLRPMRKLLFCGPPGCGKTVTAEALAESLRLPLVLVRFDAVVSSYLGETAANLSRVMDFARRNPAVYLFDEFDAIGKKRDAEEEHGELKRVVNSFLQMLDGFRGESIIVAATNHQGLLDPALWRRFDDILFFDFPDEEQAVTTLVRLLGPIGVEPDVNLKAYGPRLAGFSFADVEHLAVDAMKRTILGGGLHVTAETLGQAADSQRQRTDLTQLTERQSG